MFIASTGLRKSDRVEPAHLVEETANVYLMYR